MLIRYLPIQSRRDWRTDAACRSTRASLEVFYPERGGRAARTAKQVCAECGVRAECLQFALDHGEKFGIWGGLTERERRALRRDMAEAAVVALVERVKNAADDVREEAA